MEIQKLKKNLTRGPHLSYTHLPSSCAARRSNGGLPKLPAVRVVVEADPGFPAVGDAAKSPTTSPELATCPHSRLRLASLPFSFPGRHERRVSKLTVFTRFASSAPRIPNPLHPRLLHLSSDLPNPFNPSHDPCFIGNRRFPGRQPLKPLGALVAVELLPPVPVLFAQQLKSTLGEPLVLMLSTFLRVREVSTLVSRHAAAGHRARRRRTARVTLAPPSAPLARAPVPPDPADARTAPLRRRLALPPPAQARRRFPCFAPPLGRHHRRPPRRLGARSRGPHRDAAAAPPCGPPLATAAAGPSALRLACRRTPRRAWPGWAGRLSH